MAVLHRVLEARHGSRPAGHWVVMKTKIAGVALFAIAYAWSQRGISYFISTCGSTDVHDEKYISNYKDDFGNVTFKEINRPKILHFLYEFLPIIDEHNKQRQSVLCLEKKWATKDCWFRLLTTMVGFCIVDMHRWYRNVKARDGGGEVVKRRSRNSTLNEYSNFEFEYEVQIRKFSDILCGSLEDVTRKQLAQRKTMTISTPNDERNNIGLERIRSADGSTTRPPTKKQEEQGRRVGTAVNGNCFICRKYLTKNGTVNYQQTCFCCVICKMPLCKESRKDVTIGRIFYCLEEHKCSDEPHLLCGNYTCGKIFPEDEQINLYQRSRATPCPRATVVNRRVSNKNETRPTGNQRVTNRRLTRTTGSTRRSKQLCR